MRARKERQKRERRMTMTMREDRESPCPVCEGSGVLGVEWLRTFVFADKEEQCFCCHGSGMLKDTLPFVEWFNATFLERQR
jgi:DnaJ-class molecular chaperone